MSLKPISSLAPFSSIPDELVHLIFLHLSPSPKSAITLSLVSKRFQALAELQIWRQLTISTESGPQTGLSAKEQREATAKWLTKRLKGMMNAADERRWGLVQKATIEPTWGALHATIQILDNISTTLESLILSTPRSDKHPEWIDIRLSTCGILLSFPLLTHIRIEQSATHFVEFLIVLCDMAPNLAVLDVEICDAFEQPSEPSDSDSDSDDLLSSRLPYRFTQDTLIRNLRIFYDQTARMDGIPPDTFDIVLDLIRRSPALENLSLIFDRSDDFPAQELGPIVARLAHLTDLSWPVMDLGVQEGDGDIELYPRLQRLALGRQDRALPTNVSPPMPALVTLVIDCSLSATWEDPCREIYYAYLSEDIPRFASWITRHPHLRNIHYLCKALEGYHKTHVNFGLLHHSGKPTGTIRSVTHLGETMIQISLQFWLDDDQLASDNLVLVLADDEADQVVIPADSQVWKTFTVFKEEIVPDWVWDEMREAAGGSEKDWDARGVEVDEATWKVLQDWLEAPDRPSEEE